MLLSPLISRSARHPAANIVLVEGELHPATSEQRLLIAPYHLHCHDEEIFYVLAGRIGFEVGEDHYVAGPGDAVLVPPGAIHTWWNMEPEPARYLIAMPTRVDDLITAIHRHHYDEAEIKALFAAHDSIYIGWSR